MQQTIMDIDYERLAHLAKANDIPFDKLCERAEQGAPCTDAELLKGFLRHPTADWFTTPQASERLCVSYTSFMSMMGGSELEYYGIAYKSRSRSKPNAKRGCGLLFKRADLDDVLRLRRVLGSNTIAALRVFQAIKKGVIVFADSIDDPSSEAA